MFGYRICPRDWALSLPRRFKGGVFSRVEKSRNSFLFPLTDPFPISSRRHGLTRPLAEDGLIRLQVAECTRHTHMYLMRKSKSCKVSRAGTQTLSHKAVKRVGWAAWAKTTPSSG
jgi:hypothetical protein